MTSPGAASFKWPGSLNNIASSTPIEVPSDLEFIDVGCGDGRSTHAVRKKLNVRGNCLGIDRSGHRLPTSSVPCISFLELDLLALPNKKQCQFVTLFNVLPSVPGYAAAFELLRKSCMISRDFVYVSQANFDCDPYLLRLGLKSYYSDASVNRFHGTTADYYRMIATLSEQGLVQDFSIIESGRIYDASDEVIHPLQTPPDSGPYDSGVHRYKPDDIVFPDPIYRRVQIILTRKPAQLVPITRRLRELDEQGNIVLSSSLL